MYEQCMTVTEFQRRHDIFAQKAGKFKVDQQVWIQIKRDHWIRGKVTGETAKGFYTVLTTEGDSYLRRGDQLNEVQMEAVPKLVPTVEDKKRRRQGEEEEEPEGEFTVPYRRSKKQKMRK